MQQACWADPIIKDAIWMAWHPDSQKLLAGRVQRVCTLDPQGSVHPFLESDKLGGDGSAAWSLDGKFVLISQTDGHILVADQSGKQVTRIATGGNGLPFTAWNRSTNQIAVAEAGQPLKFCDPTKNWQLTVVGKAPIINRGSGLRWSPDGGLLSIPFHGWYDSEGQAISNRSAIEPLDWRPDGKSYAGGAPGDYAANFVIYGAGGEKLHRRHTNSHLLSFSWHPRGNLFAIGSQQSMITAWREADLQPYWHAVLLPEGKAATFSAAGELLDGKPEEVDQYLVYYVDRGDGKIETLTPAEFRKLLPQP